MLTSISRGNSRFNRIYICPSCLSGLSGTQPPRRPSRLSRCYTSPAPDVSTTATRIEPAGEKIESNPNIKSSLEKRKKLRRSRSFARHAGSRKISFSKDTLAALRASMIAEDLESKTREPQKGSSKGAEAAEVGSVEKKRPSTKEPLAKTKGRKKLSKVKEAEGATVAASMVPTDKGRTATRKTKSGTNEDKASRPRKGSKSSSKEVLAKNDLETYFDDLEKAPARARLIRIIQNGTLSNEDETKAIKLLRKSMISKTPSKTPSGDKSIKAAMLKAESTATDPSTKEVPVTVARPPKGPKGRKSGVEIVRTGPMKQRPGYDITTIEARSLKLVPLSKEQPPVPGLSYGLERVLFNPGVYQLQDPRSRVFNFDPYLQKIMPVNEFDFNALKEYITSSRDDTLLSAAMAEGKKYTGSTSSTTSALAHFHFLLSQWRAVNTGTLSRKFPVEFETFTALQRGPSAIFLRWRNGVYAIDADKEFDTANILSMLGKSMEKLLTLPTEDFEKYRKENSGQISEASRNEAESFHYTTIGDFLLRSQLDAHDPRLPGTGMFDLKTRAVVSIRMDTTEYEQGTGYEIRTRHGEWESYEREYYDMIRAAFLKYSLQVRMGRMDGIFVAFHNTERIFGFQYISLSEMDYALHGTEDTTLGDSEFKLSLELLNRVLDRATAKFPEKSLRIHFETRGGSSETPFMYIFAEPLEETQIHAIQESNKEAITEFEKRVLGVDRSPEEIQAEEKAAEEARIEAERKAAEEQRKAEWESLQARVQQSMYKDELGVGASELLERVKEGDVSMSAAEAKQQLEELISATALDDDSHDDDDEDGLGKENDDPDEEDEEADEEEDDDDENEEDDEIQEDDDDEEGDDEDEVNAEGEELESQEDSTGSREDAMPRASLHEIAADSENSSIEDATAIAGGDVSNATESTPKVHDSSAAEDAATQDQHDAATVASSSEIAQPSESQEILAMTLTIRNKVNDQYVVRPNDLKSTDKWTVEYALAEIPSQARAISLYEAAKKRRKNVLSNSRDQSKDAWRDQFIQNLRKLSRRGREWRKGQNEIDASSPVKLLEVIDGQAMDKRDRDVWGVEAPEEKKND